MPSWEGTPLEFVLYFGIIVLIGMLFEAIRQWLRRLRDGRRDPALATTPPSSTTPTTHEPPASVEFDLDPRETPGDGPRAQPAQADPALAAVLTRAVADAAVDVETVTAAQQAPGGGAPGDETAISVAAALGKGPEDVVFGATGFGVNAAIAAFRVIGADRERLLAAYRSVVLVAGDPQPVVTPLNVGGRETWRVSGLEAGAALEDGEDGEDPVMYVYAAGDVVYQVFAYPETVAALIIRRLPEPEDELPRPQRADEAPGV